MNYCEICGIDSDSYNEKDAVIKQLQAEIKQLKAERDGIILEVDAKDDQIERLEEVAILSKAFIEIAIDWDLDEVELKKGWVKAVALFKRIELELKGQNDGT